MMKRAGLLLGLALALSPGMSHARGLAVEVWTDGGNDAVYKPGDRMQIKVRSSSDAHALVYEIDAEGAIHVLFPAQGGVGLLEGRRTYRLPPEDADVELVVREPVGQCYIVAIASATPLDKLPWYLRPYNAQAEGVGFVGAPEVEEEGVTAEGRIVGDPFVAMERIRRRVVQDAQDGETFSTAYTSYYVHEAVRYPRYLCNDCHRPERWAWWDGFDPYYAQCSVFDMRVNWAWYWGPSYWYGHVPYFAFAYRSNCPPHYYPYYQQGAWCSSWDGWSSWCNSWGTGTLTRYKSPPPPGYQPPSMVGTGGKWRRDGSTPPGFLAGNVLRGRGASPLIPVGRSAEVRGEGGVGSRDLRNAPAVRPPRGESSQGPAARGVERPAPAVRSPREESPPRYTPRGEERPAPAARSPRQESSPRYAPRGEERPAPAARPPRQESSPGYAPRGEARPAPAAQSPRQESSPGYTPRSEARPAPAAQSPRQESPRYAPRGAEPSAPPAQAPRVERSAPRVQAPQADRPRGDGPAEGPRDTGAGRGRRGGR